VECLDDHSDQFIKGEKYKIRHASEKTVSFKKDSRGSTTNGWEKHHFRPCSPPSLWDKATHCFVFKGDDKPRKVERVTDILVYAETNDGSIAGYCKNPCTPLREVRTPGSKKGEFVPYKNILFKFENGSFREIRETTYCKLEADEQDTVTYEECK
jgi:hypothetical protein